MCIIYIAAVKTKRDERKKKSIAVSLIDFHRAVNFLNEKIRGVESDRSRK